MEDKKICSSCGVSMPVDAVFCPGCGQKQEIQAVEATQVEEIKTDSPEVKAPEAPKAPEAAPAPKVNPPVSSAAPQPQAYPQPPQQNPAYQQPYYQPQQAQAQPQAPAAPAKPKKKFPWVFTIAWLVMLVFVGIWTYFLMDPGYQGPEITIDTVRVVIYAVSVVLLIYTLNIKLATKKLKALPTIFLIICLLASVLLFCAYELVDGDFIHDTISPITDTFLPTLE